MSYPRKRIIVQKPGGYDLILDANGASTLRRSYHHLKPGGRLLIYGFASMFSYSGRKNLPKLIWYYLRTPRFNPFDLIYLFERIELFHQIMADLLKCDSEGLIPPMPVTTFLFEDVVSAHRAIESGKSVGKLVLVI